jgi:peroxiredoxin-like protein
MAGEEPAVRRKSFTFKTQIEWSGGRGGTGTAEGKQSFRVASPPEFKGEAGVWSPEDLLVQAANACTMTTFLSFAGRKNLPLAAYASSAAGLLEFVDGKYRFTKIEIQVQIRLKPGGSPDEAQQILHDAHEACLIANSLRADVHVVGDVKVEP